VRFANRGGIITYIGALSSLGLSSDVDVAGQHTDDAFEGG
jgi:hypothetical protein